MLIALLVLQAVGFVVLYVVLKRALVRRMSRPEIVSELRSEVGALIGELNGTTERNVALLEDGVRRLHELLARVDGGGELAGMRPAPPADRSADADSAAERRAEVVRLRRMGVSNAVIVDRLATSPGEVELIVNLAEGVRDRRSS